MINSGDEQKHLNTGSNSLEIFNSIESFFVKIFNRILLPLTDATEPDKIAKAGAVGENRTHDLTLTKGVLYH